MTSFSIAADGSAHPERVIPRSPAATPLRLHRGSHQTAAISICPTRMSTGSSPRAVAADGALTVVDSDPVTDAPARSPCRLTAASSTTRTCQRQRHRSRIDRRGREAPRCFRPRFPGSSGEPAADPVCAAPAPRASFGAKQAPPGALTRFDAGGSTGAVRFDWNFGDGTTLADGGPTPTHRYAKAGVYRGEPHRDGTHWAVRTRSIDTGQSTTVPAAPRPRRFHPGHAARDHSRCRSPTAASRPRRPEQERQARHRLPLSRPTEAARVRFTIEAQDDRSSRREAGAGPPRAATRTPQEVRPVQAPGPVADRRQAGQAHRSSRESCAAAGRAAPRHRSPSVSMHVLGGKSKARSVSFPIVRPECESLSGSPAQRPQGVASKRSIPITGRSLRSQAAAA